MAKRKSVCGLAAMTLLGLVGATSASAAVVFEETFNGLSAGNLNGSSGNGSGFTGTWSATGSVESVVATGGLLYAVSGGGTIGGDSGLLELSGNGSPAASRSFTGTSDDSVYFRFLFRANAGSLNGSDFAVFALNDSTNTTTGRIGFRIPSNASTTSSVVADAATGGTGETRGGDFISTDSTFLIVARYAKSVSGAGNNYDSMDVWVDPAENQSGTPDFTHTGTLGISSLSTLALLTASLDADDRWQFDELKAGTTWSEVVPSAVPEPATVGLLGLLAGASLLRRRAGRD